MKAYLEFDFEKSEIDEMTYKDMIQATNFKMCLIKYREVLRNEIKYKEHSEDEFKLLNELQKEFFELCRDYNINLDE